MSFVRLYCVIGVGVPLEFCYITKFSVSSIFVYGSSCVGTIFYILLSRYYVSGLQSVVSYLCQYIFSSINLEVF